MAGALVGGAFLSAFLQVLFDRMASRQVVDYFRGQNLNDRLLKKLKRTMISVNGLLDDAEEKQITKPAVQKWLDELKDAVYDADDLLDEIAYEAQRLELEAEDQTSTGPVQSFLSFLSPSEVRLGELEAKLEGLLESLDDLVNQKDVLGLINRIGEKPSSHKTPTTSLVDEFDVYGREDDKEAILKLLLSDDANGKNPGVIPIMGMGGVGKTTLAQLAYNHGRVKEWFNLKAWICVSEDFDVIRLTKDILKGVDPVTDPVTSDAKTLDRLQLELKERLREKKFLLVLDDVWNEKYADWDSLLTPLKSGAQGSKILVTTRNESVASVMQTIPPYPLKELREDCCWFVFSKHAFGDENPNAHLELQAIGREIVRKCKGLPLAAKTLGGLLRTKRDADEWEKISKSNLWDLPNDNILPALRLSYYYLPSHLKQCFAYCAIFPKDYTFGKDELVLLWMAEGFLVQSGNDEMEEAGEEYFKDLVSRSFFQQSSASPTLFVMHDLINDLAMHVSNKLCFRLESDNACKIAPGTRYLSYAPKEYFSNFEPSQTLKRIHSPGHLRTFLPLSGGHLLEIAEEETHYMFSTLRRLRVLFLPGSHHVVKLPNSIGKLKHLRYLNLFGARIDELPEDVGTLHNLQTLILKDCHQLAMLPASMGRLINLQYLDIRNTSLQETPPQMGRLTKLQRLTDFFVGKQSGCSITVLGKLNLRGELHIWNLHNVVDAQDVAEVNLKVKKHLKELKLTWNGDTDCSQQAEGILEKLEPHTNARSICIEGYGGRRYPDWAGDSSFSNVVSLVLRRCIYCTSLPPLGQLAALKDLTIEEFPEVVTVGSEFFGNCTGTKKPFESLKTLRFRGMTRWREWILDESTEIFPLLQELQIFVCPNLTKALPQYLPCLTTVGIVECPQLVIPFARYPIINELYWRDDSRSFKLARLPSELHSLRAHRFHSLHFLPKEIEKMGCSPTALEKIDVSMWSSLNCFPLESFPRLKTLFIAGCLDLESFSAHEGVLDDLTSLNILRIRRIPKLVSFPRGGLPAPNLTLLELQDCINLKLLPEHMHCLLPSLEALRIYDCPEIESFPEGGLPSKLHSLEIWGCEKLIAGRMQWDLQSLPCLLTCTIGGDYDIESFPEGTLLPSSLTSLEIVGFHNLKYLDYKGIRHLSSLRELKLVLCSKLNSMPEEGLPSSLSYLFIHECPLLAKRCERDKGEVWPKISHIPTVQIGLR